MDLPVGSTSTIKAFENAGFLGVHNLSCSILPKFHSPLIGIQVHSNWCFSLVCIQSDCCLNICRNQVGFLINDLSQLCTWAFALLGCFLWLLSAKFTCSTCLVAFMLGNRGLSISSLDAWMLVAFCDISCIILLGNQDESTQILAKAICSTDYVDLCQTSGSSASSKKRRMTVRAASERGKPQFHWAKMHMQK
jgi:hypothetical protein